MPSNDSLPEKNKLSVEKLLQDSRIAKAKDMILAAVASYQSEIESPAPAFSDRIDDYHEILKAFGIARGGNLWYPFLGSGFGKGALVQLYDGSIKYDLISGIGPHFFGHSHPLIIEAAFEAALSDTIMEGHLQQNHDSYVLINKLLDCSKLDHCFLSSSGAMANENALKIAFQKNSPAHRILAFDHCFTGRTLALSQITDKPQYRDGLPSMLQVDYVPFYDYKDPLKSTHKACEILNSHLKHHPGQYAAFVLELVQGEGGIYPGTVEFFTSLLKIARAHKIAIIFDEIQTFGRTTEIFAFQYFGLQEYADIVTLGKLAQACATLFKSNYKPKPGLLSQTFSASTAAIKSSIAILKELTNGSYYGQNGKVAQLNQSFASLFQSLADKYPKAIHGPYGVGAMIAFTPFDGQHSTAQTFTHALFESGIISFIAGSSPTRVRFLPPIGVLTKEDLIRISQIIEKVIIELEPSLTPGV